MTDSTFEAQLARDLGRYAGGGVRPIDADAIAASMIATGRPWGPMERLTGPWLGRVRITPRLVIVALLAILAIGIALTAVGLQTRRPPELTNRTEPSMHPAPPSAPIPAEGATVARIAYVQDGNVFVAGTDGSDPTAVLDDPGVAFTNVRWLTDGRHVAVESPDLVSVLDLTTGEHRRLDLPVGMSVVWRPGGDELAGIRPAPFGEPTVLVITDALTGATREIPADAGLSALAWSSDGSSLGALRGQGFVRIDATTGHSTVVATVPDGGPQQVSWTPDLSRIAYVLTPDSGCDMQTKTCGPDQSSIYVTDGRPGASAAPVVVAGPLPQTQLDGNNHTTVFGPPPMPTWSPDGAWVAYRTADGLSIVRPDGTGRRDVVTVPVGTFRWQADGTRLLFSSARDTGSGDGELFVVDLDGGTPRSLGVAGVSQIAGQATGPADIAPAVVESAPAPSAPVGAAPDGTARTPALPEGPFRLFVGADPAGACDRRTFEIDVETRTSHAIGACGAALTADGRHLVHRDTVEDMVNGTTTTFPGQVGTSPQDRWVTLADGSSAGSTWTIATWDASRLMTMPPPYLISPAYGFASPAWSPDERQVAIRTGKESVVVLDLTTGTRRTLTDYPSWVWASGGDRTGFIRDGDAWMADADGNNARNLSQFAFGGATGIELSPDGGTAAVTQERSLWLIDVDGRRRQIDTHTLFGDQLFEVIWSPDGGRLALVAGVPDEGRGHGRTVMIGRDGRTLADVEAAQAVWSPTGDVLAAAVDPQDLEQGHTTAPVGHHKGTTYLIDRDGVTQTVRDAWQPTWSPDGRTLAILTGAGAVGHVDLVFADGSHRHRVSPTIRRPGGLVWMR